MNFLKVAHIYGSLVSIAWCVCPSIPVKVYVPLSPFLQAIWLHSKPLQFQFYEDSSRSIQVLIEGKLCQSVDIRQLTSVISVI